MDKGAMKIVNARILPVLPGRIGFIVEMEDGEDIPLFEMDVTDQFFESSRYFGLSIDEAVELKQMTDWIKYPSEILDSFREYPEITIAPI